MPYADDPDVPNVLDQGVGQDVFAYALGYYQGDYKPINPNLGTADARDQVWTRQSEAVSNSGLFNGNISWMVTDLSKIGEINNDRKKGMQGMLYKYDQLHRIMKSRSLVNYTENGFAARTTTGAYDEEYTYDPNGNLLTLQRNNEQAQLSDDFHYKYYPNSNKLREVKPLTKDKVYKSGELQPDNVLYQDVTVEGNSYVSSGKTVDLQALKNIYMDPNFNAKQGSDFWAHIVEDEGTYQYDAIGNLIKDQDEGVLISWTPYGKVREVHTKGDSINVYFRYDAAGNRVEKRVERRDTTSNVSITRYVRDASGNVMAVYNDSTMIEQPLYGNSRLGQYIGGRTEGYQTIGSRKFELSNHLGNVLAVTTDNINVNSDSTWANVLGTSDYYPFGLEMDGRVWADTTSGYRYGFNGKEKDIKGEWGNVAYDYGFRIYDPTIARFKSVDPLTATYPWYTPFQFAGNKPIWAIDIDGLEELIRPFERRQYQPVFSAPDAGTATSNATNNALIFIPNVVVGMGNGIIGVINYTYKSYVNDSNPILDAEYETRRSVEKEVKRVSKLSPSEMGSELLDVATDLRSYESFAEFLLLKKLAPSKTLPANRNISTKPGGITLKDFDLQVGPSFESFSTVIKDGRINISSRAVTSGKFDFVITADGELKVGFGHSYLSGGASTVKAAGQLDIFQGKIKSITNNSGHYKPSILESENFGNLLREQGLDLNGVKLKQYDASGKIEKTTTLQ